MQDGSLPEAYRRLLDRPRWGDGPGLERMAWLRRELVGGSAPLPTLHVVGSNGKGTVAHLAAAVLGALGVPCGLYVSPHFRRFEERVQLAGKPVARGVLAEALAAADAAARRWEAERGERFAAFEVLTGAALEIFVGRFAEGSGGRRGVIVAEAGVGGRLDSTAIFEGRVAALTGVELEHTAVLGRDRSTIALDKAGIVPPGGVLVTAPLGGEEGDSLEGGIEEDLGRRGARLVRLEEAWEWQAGEARLDEAGRPRRLLDLLPGGPAGVPPGSAAPYPELSALEITGLELSLAGRHQVVNGVLAVAAVTALLEEYGPLGGLPVEDATAPRGGARVAVEGAVRRGLARARVAGRFEKLEAREPGAWAPVAVYVDVAHTPVSLEALAETARELFVERPWGLVAGVSEGRDPAMLAPLVEAAAWTVVTRSRYRGVETEKVARALGAAVTPAGAPATTARGRPFHLESSGEEALRAAVRWAGGLSRSSPSEPVPVLVTGSYFLAAEAAAVLEGRDPAALLFQ